MNGARKWLGLIGWIALPLLAGVGGSMFPARDYYRVLETPSWAPPSWLFGPVWTTLYVLMGVAAWLVWMTDDSRKRSALTAFVVQLVLNFAWSWIFFGMRNPGAALVEILVLLAAIVVTAVLFWRVHRTAGVLLLPYLAWTSFATALNFSIWSLNRS